MEDARAVPEDLLEADWQLPVEDLRDSQWEVVVVGAGPAGAMCALHLARAGRRVLLLDQAHFPREKTCGDGLISDAFAELSRVGLLDAVRDLGRVVSSASITSPSGFEFRIPAEYITLKRRTLDALVAREAVRAGAVFHFGEGLHVRINPDNTVRVEIEESAHPVTARVLVVATGSAVRFAREVGAIVRPQSSAVATRCYVRSRFKIDRIVGVYLRSTAPGYGWIFPMKDDLYNVGTILFSRYRRGRHANIHEAYDAFTQSSELARRLLAEGEVVGPRRTAMIRTGLTGSRLLGRGPIVAVGEAAGSTLPLFAEGVGKAMHTGRLAAEVIAAALDADDAGLLREYPRRIESELRRFYRGLARAERYVGIRAINDFMSWRTSHSPFLQNRLAALVNGLADPQDVFSLRAAVQSLWR